VSWLTPNLKGAQTSRLVNPCCPRRRRLDHQRIEDVHPPGAQCQYVFLITTLIPRLQSTEPDHVSGATDSAGMISGHPHRRRRPHQHRLLQRRPRRRQVPAGARSTRAGRCCANRSTRARGPSPLAGRVQDVSIMMAPGGFHGRCARQDRCERLRSGIPIGTGLLTTNRWRTGWAAAPPGSKRR